MSPDPKIANLAANVKKDTSAMNTSVHKRIMIAPSLRAAILVLSLGVAIPPSVIAIGYAIRLATSQEQAPNSNKVVQESVASGDLSESKARAGSAVDPGKLPNLSGAVVRNYVIFTEEVVELNGKPYRVNAGHNYSSNAQEDYDDAYCYAAADMDGLEIRLKLSFKDNASLAPRETEDASAKIIGLGDAELAELRTACRYL